MLQAATQRAYMAKQLCDSCVIANNARKTQKLFIQLKI